jgi:hypothetical protein
MMILAGCARLPPAGGTAASTTASVVTSESSSQTGTSGETALGPAALPTTMQPSASPSSTQEPAPPAEPSSDATPSRSDSTMSTTTSQAQRVPSATLPQSISGPGFSANIEEIDEVIGARLIHSWREGCPVALADLRLVTLTHWNFAGEAARGELVVHNDHAAGVVEVFSMLYDARFPIERMELVDFYEGDDDLSMAANNTSAFNCREVAWKPGVWSNHAFGSAIDINPLVNPYVSSTLVLPPEGDTFADRSVEVLGGLYLGDAATQAFAMIGWTWGGTWSPAKDWQHFSASGG